MNELIENQERMSLVNLAGGAAVESFDKCLEEVLDNISDINTSEKDRTITLTVKIKPLEGRSIFTATFSCQSKLQNQDPVAFAADLKVDPNKRHCFAVERRMKRSQIPLQFKPRIAETNE